MDGSTLDLLWRWISLVELPALGALAWLLIDTRGKLNKFELKVAEDYASQRYLKDVEDRIMERLHSIEALVKKIAFPGGSGS